MQLEKNDIDKYTKTLILYILYKFGEQRSVNIKKIFYKYYDVNNDLKTKLEANIIWFLERLKEEGLIKKKELPYMGFMTSVVYLNPSKINNIESAFADLPQRAAELIKVFS